MNSGPRSNPKLRGRRLRHEPVRYLSAAELNTAHRLGYVTTALYDAERHRRYRERLVDTLNQRAPAA
jgi:hypothetical protein